MVIIDSNLLVTVNSELLSETIVACTLKINDTTNIGEISIYLDDKMYLSIDLQTIQKVIEKLGTNDIIIGEDLNVYSSWWSSQGRNSDILKRGSEIMRFVAQYDLNVLNQGSVATYYTIRQGVECTSVVDVTLCSINMLGRIKGWKTEEEIVTLSDHRQITFSVEFQGAKFVERIGTRLYNAKKARWTIYILESIQYSADYPKETPPFGLKEIKTVFNHMNPRKSPGADGLTSDICQRAFIAAHEINLAIFIMCLEPYRPLFITMENSQNKNDTESRKDDYSAPKSYRPIGLLPVMGKVIKKMIATSIAWFLGE